MSDEVTRPMEWTERLFETHEPGYAYEGETGAAFGAWQTRARARLREILGLEVVERGGRVGPDPRHRGTVSAAGYERQTWDLRTEAGHRVPFYLLVPSAGDPPYPTVLTIHGHTDYGKDLAAGLIAGEDREQLIDREQRDVAVQAVERGYAAIAPDMRGFGELAPPEDPRTGGACRTLQLRAQLFGRTLAGDRVWDTLRLADFATEHDPLDGDRLAITGHSGGGAVALFAAALDERVSPAVVSSYFCTIEDSYGTIDHCTCNYVPGIADLGETWNVAGLVAPRPIRFLAGREDHIFPIEGVRRAFGRLEPIYEAAGAPDACDRYEFDRGHGYDAEGAWSFVAEYL